jgi:hypothetical protein
MDMTRHSSFSISILCFSFVWLALGCRAEQSVGTLDSGQVWVADAGPQALVDAGPSSLGDAVETAIDDATIASSRWLPDGDIETELRDVRTGRLLGKAWLSVFDGKWSYTFLSETSGGRGEVFTTTYPADASIDLEEVNERFAALWRAQASSDSLVGVEDYVDYAPGCHLLKVPFSSPNNPRNHCMQNCCSIFDAWEYTYLCKQIPFVPPLKFPTWSSLAELPISPCAVGLGLKASCIANCGLLPPPEHYGECFSGEHQCFDDRCQLSWPKSTLYCATNCYTDPAPCDVKPTGSTEFCSIDDGAEHSCQDGALRQGYWAADCDTAVASCECRDQDKWRCADDRCAAGRKGYCGTVVEEVKNPTQVITVDQACDKKDLGNPCCGDAGQPCCDGVCAAATHCISGSCIACGRDDQAPCNTPAGLRCEDGYDYRGTGNCRPCGFGDGDVRQRCCTESVQYRGSNNDPCPDCSPWGDDNSSQCIAGTCQLCGGRGDVCCGDEGLTRRVSSGPDGCAIIERFDGVECSGNESCDDGVCPPCGKLNENCCPGGVHGYAANHCLDDEHECRSGTCQIKEPDLPDLAPVRASGFANCGNVELTIRNAGTARVTRDFNISWSVLNGGIFTTVWTQDLDPGQQGTTMFSTGFGNPVPILGLSVKLDWGTTAAQQNFVQESNENNNVLCASGEGACRDYWVEIWDNPQCN